VSGLVGTASVALPDAVTFAISAAIVLSGGLGVVLSRNPVHSALSLVATLGGVAVLFLEQQADFLAAVQVIVYGGAIVVLFLFVVMLLGVDREESIGRETLPLQRPLAVLIGACGLAAIIVLARFQWATGAHSASGPATSSTTPNVNLVANSIFTAYLLPFEATAFLLVIAVVAAVLLARRRRPGADGPLPTGRRAGDSEEVGDER
jgi:NADH-quinone oxidoreductase subunit J